MKNKHTSPWAWIPTLYFAQGLPYVAVMTISVIMYKRLGISNTELAFYTGWLNLPWVIKPLWSPFIDLIKTKRWWIITMQLLIGAGLAGIAFTIPTEHFFQLTLAVFWLLAFSSATHDIAADGFYMLALDSHRQALFVGIRSTFYRIATIAGQGLLIMLAGRLEIMTDNIPYAWSITFFVLAGLFLGIWIIISLFFPVRIQIILPKKFPLPICSKSSLVLLPVSFKKSRQALPFFSCYSTVCPKLNWQKCAFLSL